MTDFKNMALKPDIENIIGHSIRTIYMWYISAYKKITGFQVHSHNSFLNYIVLQNFPTSILRCGTNEITVYLVLAQLGPPGMLIVSQYFNFTFSFYSKANLERSLLWHCQFEAKDHISNVHAQAILHWRRNLVQSEFMQYFCFAQQQVLKDLPPKRLKVLF